MANTATQLLLTRVDHESKMVSVMRNLFSSGLLTDVTLSCEGQVIHAHRLVLASVSTYFESIFQSPLVSNQPNPVVILKDMKLSDLKAIIEFVYSGEVRVQENQLESLVKSAETLDISGLSRICPNPMSHLQQTRSSKSLSPNVSPILEPPILREERTNNQALVNKLSVPNEVPFKEKNNVCNIESDPAAGLKYKYQFHPDSSSSHKSNSTCASSMPAEDYADLTDAATIAKRNAKRAKRSVTSGTSSVMSDKDILTGIKQSLPISKINDRSEQITSSPSLRPRSPEMATPTPAPRYKKTSTSSEVPESHQTTRSQTRIPFGKLVLIQKGDVPVSKEFPLHYKDYTIGRDPSCHLKICDSLVSDTHCVISYDGLSEPKLINRAKATKLNGQLMVGQTTLKTGDIIEIADRKLRFEFTPQIQSPQKPSSYANGSSNLLTTKSEDDMLAAASNRMSLESNKQASKSSQDLDVKPIISKHNTIETDKHVQKASTSFDQDGSFPQEPASNSQSSNFTRLKHPDGTSSSGRLRPRRHMRKNLRRVCAERDRRNRMRLSQMG